VTYEGEGRGELAPHIAIHTAETITLAPKQSRFNDTNSTAEVCVQQQLWGSCEEQQRPQKPV